MTAGELSSAAAVGRGSHLPWGAIGDMGGLVVAVAIAADRVGLRRTGPFVFLLFGFGLVTWLVLRQLQPKLPGLIRVGYRFILAPPVAAVLALVACAAMRTYYSRSAIALYVVLWTLCVALGRYSFRRLAPPLRVLCIGDAAVARELSAQRRFHVELLQSPPVEYRPADLVVIGSRALGNRAWLRWLLQVELSGVPLMSAARARESLTGRVPLEDFGEAWARGAFGEVKGYQRAKRGFDVVAVVLASPLIVLLGVAVALAVLLDSGRPVLFEQLRVGRAGRLFRLHKFRTMRKGSESHGPEFARTHDPRVTRVGRWLRETRLDELPQFWNVLLGDMSIIGPRPEQLGFAEAFDCEIPLYSLRQSVRPGITGWAQVCQGYAAGAAESSVKVSYDLYYVKNCSLYLDLLIAMHTVRTVLTMKGAR